MANWQTAKKVASGGGTVNRLNLSKDIPVGTSKRIRLVGDLIPRYVYWVDTHSGKRTVECLSFDRESQAFNNQKDDLLIGVLDEKGEQLKYQFGYVTQCIDRDDGLLKVVELKKTIFNDIVVLANDSDYGNPSDPESGYDISVGKESTGPLPMNVKYKCLPGRSNTPLTDAEEKIELYDIGALYSRPSKEEQELWLRENTDYLKEAPIHGELEDGLDDDLPI